MFQIHDIINIANVEIKVNYYLTSNINNRTLGSISNYYKSKKSRAQ